MSPKSLLLLLALTILTACGPSGERVCQFRCYCEGCSVAEQTACQSAVDRDEQTAETFGCSEQYKNLVSCQSDGICMAGAYYKTSCEAEESLWKDCTGQH